MARLRAAGDVIIGKTNLPAIWNMTGQPAISIPAPPSRDGLPIGAQLIAPEDGEERLLGLAAQLERELAWPGRRPPLA